MLAEARQLEWRNVPWRVRYLYKQSGSKASEIQNAIKQLPSEGLLAIWHNAADDKILANFGDWTEQDELNAYREALSPLCGSYADADEMGSPGDGDWVKVAVNKVAYSKTLRNTLTGLNFFPNRLNQYIPGAPSPLAAMLTSGLVGAGLGYGAGWLGEQVLPANWRRKRLRRTLALMGGLGGASLAAPWMAQHALTGQSVLDPGTSTAPVDTLQNAVPGTTHGIEQELAKLSYVQLDPMTKKALSATGLDYLGYHPSTPPINVPYIRNTVLHDPRVSNQLSMPLQMGTVGLLDTAAHRAGANLISPLDVARITAGMGTGYLSGALVGKALGALTGMPSSTQDRLKNTGMWAGIISNIVPIAFGA